MNDDRFQVYAEKLYEKDEKICTFLGHFWAGFVQGSRKEFLEIQFDMLAQSQPDLKFLCNKKKYVFKRCSRFYFKERNRKNHADKSKTIFNLCIRKLQRYPNQFRDTFLNVVPKFTRKEKICLRKSFHRDGDFLSEHFVQYFTFVPPLCDVKLI